MRKTADELINSVKSFIGDDTSDEAIGLLEDIADSVDTSSSDAAISERDTRIAELETALADSKAKYVARFGSNEATADTSTVINEVDTGDNADLEDASLEDLAKMIM